MEERHRFGGKSAPPWWPEGESWPPQRGPGYLMRRMFMRRLGFLFLALLALFIGFLILGIVFGDHRGGEGQEDWQGWNGPPIFGIVVLIGGGYLIYRLLRRTAQPVSELMEATGRLAEGDYSIRVTPHGSSEARDLAGAFNALAERLEQNENQRRALIADVTHELRTPLSVIRGAAEGIIDGVYPGDSAHVSPIVDEVEMMARLLDDLAMLSTAEAGLLSLQKERVSPRQLVDDATAIFRPRYDAAGLTLSNDVPADLPAIEVDPLRMRQVLSNLLGNALQHTASGGMAISGVQEASNVVLRVADTGAGIPSEQLPHIFERLRKSDDSRGSGLGLAIAKSLVEAHGGRISAESIVGRGTTIVVELPVSQAM